MAAGHGGRSVGSLTAMHALSLFAQDNSSGGGNPATLLIFLLIPVAMYFLMIRPQRRRMKEQATMQSSIDIGDEVITNSGIYGFVAGVDGDKFWLEIDDDVQIRIARAAIQSRVKSDDGTSGDDNKPDRKTDDPDADLRGAKAVDKMLGKATRRGKGEAAGGES
jgi:preprotein translocase subunit YajC